MVPAIALVALLTYSIAPIRHFLHQLDVVMVRFAPFLDGALQQPLAIFPPPCVLPPFSFEGRHIWPVLLEV